MADVLRDSRDWRDQEECSPPHEPDSIAYGASFPRRSRPPNDSGYNYDIVFSPEAIEDLYRIRAHDRKAIKDAIETHLRREPGKVSKSRIKRLRGLRKPQYRLRMDDFRVFYDVSDDMVSVLAVVAKADTETWLAKRGGRER